MQLITKTLTCNWSTCFAKSRCLRSAADKADAAADAADAATAAASLCCKVGWLDGIKKWGP